MKKILGILSLLVFVFVATSILSGVFLDSYNLENLLRRTALFGIISIGVAFVIITGGIDLSIGSVVCLVGCGLPWMLTEQGVSVPVALAAIIAFSLAVGLIHGILITKVKLQPFVVTLCGLLLYRGITRGFTEINLRVSAPITRDFANLQPEVESFWFRFAHALYLPAGCRSSRRSFSEQDNLREVSIGSWKQ